MKYKFAVFAFIILFCNTYFAQSDTSKANKWISTAVIGLNISQLALSNWTQGGDNSLTWTLVGRGGLNYAGEYWSSRNNLKIAFGRTKLGSEDFRTNDNELYLENVISRKIGWAIDPYFSNTVRTALTTGYKYTKDDRTAIADFFDPGYVTQSLGFTYDRIPGFKTRLGFAVQEVFTNKFRQYSDDTSTAKLETFKLETGLESVTSAEYEVFENILAKSSLRLFSRYESLDVWDVRWDNSIVAKVNNFLNVNFTFLLVYEKAQSLTAQMKQALQLGFVYTIF
jgi:hypothetical protein